MIYSVGPFLFSGLQIPCDQVGDFVESQVVDGVTVRREHGRGSLEPIVELACVECEIVVIDSVLSHYDGYGPVLLDSVDFGGKSDCFLSGARKALLCSVAFNYYVSGENPFDVRGAGEVFTVESELYRLPDADLVAFDKKWNGLAWHSLDACRRGVAFGVLGNYRDSVVDIVRQAFQDVGSSVTVRYFDTLGLASVGSVGDDVTQNTR